MNLLMIICPEERRHQITALLEKRGIHSFTEFPQVMGSGISGKHLGSHVWPGKSTLVFTVVPDEVKAELVAELKNCQTNLFPGEGMKAFVLPVEEEF